MGGFTIYLFNFSRCIDILCVRVRELHQAGVARRGMTAILETMKIRENISLIFMLETHASFITQAGIAQMYMSY